MFLRPSNVFYAEYDLSRVDSIFIQKVDTVALQETLEARKGPQRALRCIVKVKSKNHKTCDFGFQLLAYSQTT